MTLGPGDPFRNVGGRGIKLKEMLDLAAHIVHTKSGHFDLSRLEDRYENALIDLLKKKQAGEKDGCGRLVQSF
jgi:DNA end-binding protein Ku